LHPHPKTAVESSWRLDNGEVSPFFHDVIAVGDGFTTTTPGLKLSVHTARQKSTARAIARAVEAPISLGRGNPL
jgi:hypothetical protein